jgi:hypothetical protein
LPEIRDHAGRHAGLRLCRRPQAEGGGLDRLIHAYLRGRANLARVYVLIDARHGLKDSDAPALDARRGRGQPPEGAAAHAALRRAIVVVKYGGHAMGDEPAGAAFARDIVLLEQTGVNPGRGARRRAADRRMLNKLGIKSSSRPGLRVTDKATVEIVEMVLAGSINKQIVGFINAEGGKAIGLCGKDGNMVTPRR